MPAPSSIFRIVVLSAALRGITETAKQNAKRQNKDTVNLVNNGLAVIIKPKQNLKEESNPVHVQVGSPLIRLKM